MLKIKRNHIISQMHDKGISIAEIASRLNIDIKTVYNVINKKNTPSVTLAKSLASLFNISIDEMFDFEEE